MYLVRSGGRIAEMSNALNASIRSTGNLGIAVTNLGTTDALRPGRTASSRLLLGPLVSATAGVPCVVLTTVNVQADKQTGGTVAAQINHQIKALALSDPTKYKVVDWNEFLVTLPPPSVPTYLQANSLLETPAGAAWLAKSDQAAVRTCGSTHQPTVIGPNSG